jgi:hypothetical protein
MNCRVEFPVLNSTTTFKVNSTGDVDCNVLAASVVNATLGYYPSDPFGNNQSVICDSRRGSVRTFRYGPGATKASGSNGRLDAGGGMFLWAVLMGWMSLVL